VYHNSALTRMCDHPTRAARAHTHKPHHAALASARRTPPAALCSPSTRSRRHLIHDQRTRRAAGRQSILRRNRCQTRTPTGAVRAHDHRAIDHAITRTCAISSRTAPDMSASSAAAAALSLPSACAAITRVRSHTRARAPSRHRTEQCVRWHSSTSLAPVARLSATRRTL
jgi:hypothetical protein